MLLHVGINYLADQVEDHIGALPELVVHHVGVLATVWLKVDASPI